MLKRMLSVAVLLMLAASISQAALRAPQVPISGTALATFFASQGQTINVNTQQLDLQALSLPATANFELRTFGPEAGSDAFGAYNIAPPSPALYLIAPGAASPGWFEVAAFRASPTRLVVNIFDPSSTIQGSTTYMGADPTGFGLYAQNAGASTFFTQDARNPGGSARILAFNGTGAKTGWTWFAVETGPGPGGDYADFITAVNLAFTAPVPTSKSSWGRIKRLYN